MPPSKADPEAKNPDLQLPMVYEANKKVLCPCLQLWELIAMSNAPKGASWQQANKSARRGLVSDEAASWKKAQSDKQSDWKHRVSEAERKAFTPLFRMNSRSIAPISMTQVMATVKSFCIEARLDPKGLGTKAWRIGGMCRLQDLGASVPQIAAMGRWSSDALFLYARVNEKESSMWARKMLGTSGSSNRLKQEFKAGASTKKK